MAPERNPQKRTRRSIGLSWLAVALLPQLALPANGLLCFHSCPAILGTALSRSFEEQSKTPACCRSDSVRSRDAAAIHHSHRSAHPQDEHYHFYPEDHDHLAERLTTDQRLSLAETPAHRHSGSDESDCFERTATPPVILPELGDRTRLTLDTTLVHFEGICQSSLAGRHAPPFSLAPPRPPNRADSSTPLRI